MIHWCILAIPLWLCGTDELAGWRSGVTARPVLERTPSHSIHSYFNTCPESPDGRWVLLYRSREADGHRGEICVVERATGTPRVLVRDVNVEDAHRVACQQWLQGGRTVAFHDLREGHWVVACVDVETGQERVVARDRQLAWGQPHGDLVPLYGPHWDPGPHRDLEVLDVRTGNIRTILTADAVRSTYPDAIEREFGSRPISIFFPIFSPDLKRVLFKLATPAGGGFRHPRGSDRQGLYCYDLDAGRLIFMYPRWGHPAWHPDSRTVLEVWSKNLVRINVQTAEVVPSPRLPALPGAHPSFSPDGRLFVADAREAGSSTERDWTIVVGDFEGSEPATVHRFADAGGARSWRGSHPHPVFGPDGTRIYFNTSDGPWTRLFVAHRAARP